MTTITPLDLQQGRAALIEATAFLVALAQDSGVVGNTDLAPLFRQVDDIRRLGEATQVGLLGDALRRGVVAESQCPSATSWVIDNAPSYRGGGAGQLVKVTQACLAARTVALADAVLSGRVSVRNASVALAQMEKLRPRLRPEAVDTVWDGFIQIATDHGPAEIRALRDYLIATYGNDEEFQKHQDDLKHGVSLSQPFDDDGMSEYRLRLDPEGKEVLEAILGPLSAPKPTNNTPDLRSSDQRRGEALIQICRRAAAAGGAAPLTPKAAVYVTINYEDLKNRTWAGTVIADGQLLAPETIRKMACDAMIIPVVLGTDNEVMDVGRTRRLFPPGMLRALWLRDKGCTIPGCTTPPFWADAHHLVHWIDGGPTSLLNGALLCGRHHTLAHQRGWTATATTTEVTWHL